MIKSLRRTFYHLTAPRDLHRSIRKLRKLESRLPSAASRFAVPWAYRGYGLFRGIHAHQTPLEIETLYQRVCELRPATVLEIGTARGGTFYLWAQAATDDALLISVDMPGGFGGGGYPRPREQLYRAFARQAQRIDLLRADSHDPKTRDQVTGLLGGRPVDWCFIDGDHTYEGVKADLLAFAPLVRAGGLIGFHDIMPRPDVLEIEVDRLWSQLRARWPDETEQIMHPNERGEQVGIGLLRVPSAGLDLSGL